MASSAKKYVRDDGTVPIHVPFLNLHSRSSTSAQTMIAESDFKEAYDPFQALHIRGYKPSAPPSSCDASTHFRASEVLQLFESLNGQDKLSWCVENEAANNNSHSNGTKKSEVAVPREFLDITNKNHRGYCSFLVQHSNDVMDNLLMCLPMVHLPIENESESKSEGDDTTMKVQYGPCLWIFFGKNYSKDETEGTTPSLQGRPEHTDSVTHDGTGHYQLSGESPLGIPMGCAQRRICFGTRSGAP